MVVLGCMEEPVLLKFAQGNIWATPPADDKLLSLPVEREGDDDDDGDNGIDVAPAA